MCVLCPRRRAPLALAHGAQTPPGLTRPGAPHVSGPTRAHDQRVNECRAPVTTCPCSVHVPTLNGTLGHHVCEGTSVGSADPVFVLAVWQRQ